MMMIYVDRDVENFKGEDDTALATDRKLFFFNRNDITLNY